MKQAEVPLWSTDFIWVNALCNCSEVAPVSKNCSSLGWRKSGLEGTGRWEKQETDGRTENSVDFMLTATKASKEIKVIEVLSQRRCHMHSWWQQVRTQGSTRFSRFLAMSPTLLSCPSKLMFCHLPLVGPLLCVIWHRIQVSSRPQRFNEYMLKELTQTYRWMYGQVDSYVNEWMLEVVADI